MFGVLIEKEVLEGQITTRKELLEAVTETDKVDQRLQLTQQITQRNSRLDNLNQRIEDLKTRIAQGDKQPTDEVTRRNQMFSDMYEDNRREIARVEEDIATARARVAEIPRAERELAVQEKQVNTLMRTIRELNAKLRTCLLYTSPSPRDS